MARRVARQTRRQEPDNGGKRRKSGGLFLGVLLGLALGLVAAAGMAWYFNLSGDDFKTVEQAPDLPLPVSPEADKAPVAQPSSPGAAPAAPSKAKENVRDRPAAPVQERKPPPPPPATRVPLTFYGILPGEQPAKPVEPPKPQEIWWLQVAALKNPADADRLKARLTLLGLEVLTQEVESAGQTLYRVRVGPYNRDEDAFADLDTLAAHDYEPRLFKEPAKP